MDAPSPPPVSRQVVTDEGSGVQQVGDWLLGVTLGKGSFGKVKLATHCRTREKVAVKIVDKASISNVDDVERVYRETFILTTLKHPHIIKLFEVLDTPDAIMLVMEYAGGGELYSYVHEQRRLPEPLACRLFTQILNGVEYCHRAKIIHRDLKLENILLTEHSTHSSPSVKIADFGLSNSIRLNEKMGTNCGTPSYTCPEQILGLSYIGSAADIWSLGVIFFAMIAGFLPFEATSIPTLFKRIKAGLYLPPPYISHEAKDLIARMLTLDPDKRATIAELRSHPWVLMDYTELGERIEGMGEVGEGDIEEAHAACQGWTGEGEGGGGTGGVGGGAGGEGVRRPPPPPPDKPREETKEEPTTSPPPSSSTSLSPFSPPLRSPPLDFPSSSSDSSSTLPTPSSSSSSSASSTSRPSSMKPRPLHREPSKTLSRPPSSIFDKLSIRTSQPTKPGGGAARRRCRPGQRRWPRLSPQRRWRRRRCHGRRQWRGRGEWVEASEDDQPRHAGWRAGHGGCWGVAWGRRRPAAGGAGGE